MVGTRRRIKKKKDGFIKKALKEICNWIFLIILMVLVAAPLLCISAFVEIINLFRRNK